MIGFLVAAATQLVFLTPARQVGTGVCSGEVKIQFQDAAGAPVVPPTATLVTLSGAVTYFDNSQCGGTRLDPNEGVAVQVGSSTLSVWVLAIHAGPVMLGASSPGLTPAAQAWTVTFAAGVPTAVVGTSGPLTATSGVCSSAVTVELRDANGGPATATRAQAATLEPSGFLEFWGDPGCSTQRLHQLDFAQGAGKASFQVRGGSTVASAHVRVTLPGLDTSDTLATFSQATTGCAAGGLAGAWALLPLLLVRRRRAQAPSTRR